MNRNSRSARCVCNSGARNRTEELDVTTPFEPEAKGPLQGLVVLDMSRLVAGNMLSLQLADFGAEVLKIEDPAKGDPLRDWRVNGISTFWKVYARNKKSVTLNLREPDGMAILRKLIGRTHVLIEN